MFRDFQENTINSDGWFAWFVLLFCGGFVVHEFYSYILPYHWLKYSVKNGEFERLRMKDALATAVAEEIVGNQFSECVYSPHNFHQKRFQGSQGYINPDDPRVGSFYEDHPHCNLQQTSQNERPLQDKGWWRKLDDDSLSNGPIVSVAYLPNFKYKLIKVLIL